MTRSLRKVYVGREGLAPLHSVEPHVFTLSYFGYCMDCRFCHDSCCAYGADIDRHNHQRLLEWADELERFLGIPREEWFDREWVEDPEFPGGSYTRTVRRGGGCVFLNPVGRGCLIHQFCLTRGLDFHQLKPLICTLFPITFDEGVLHANLELRDGSLVCLGDGPSVYRSSRDDLRYYYGPDLVAELDEMEAEVLAAPAGTARTYPLPVLPAPV